MSVLVSVIMPTYNCGAYIAESIDSVLAQTLSSWELIVVDDCSTDNTEEIVSNYSKQYPNIFFYKLEENGGPAAARSLAIKMARGKYCAFLDSDDLWMPDKLEKQIRFMQEKGALFSCTAYRQISETGEDLHTRINPPRLITYKKCVLLGNPIGNLTAMYDQEKLGKFEVPPIKKRNDFALWLQILKKTPYCYGMEDVLSKYRLGRHGSVSHNKLIQAKYHWILYHDLEKHNALKSCFEVLSWAFVKVCRIGKHKDRSC